MRISPRFGHASFVHKMDDIYFYRPAWNKIPISYFIAVLGDRVEKKRWMGKDGFTYFLLYAGSCHKNIEGLIRRDRLVERGFLLHLSIVTGSSEMEN